MSDSSAIVMGNVDQSLFQQKASINAFVPVSGGTVTIPDKVGDQIVVIKPAADLATLTIAWPSNPYDGQVIRILCTKNISDLLHTGGTLNRSVPYIPATGDMTFVYDASSSTFMSSGITLSTVVSLPFTVSTTGGSGNAAFYPTNTGLVDGTALFSSIQDVTAKPDIADPNIGLAKAVVSNGNKTITINVQKQTFNIVTVLATNVLGSLTLGAAPNGVSLTVYVHGILA
jgi:hypothetical protein